MWVYPHRYFHLSQTNLGQIVRLRPTNGWTPNGVSFSPTIRGCLNGVPFYYNRNGKEKIRDKDWKERREFLQECNLWYVYSPIAKTPAIIPDVDDFDRTRERRVLKPIKCILIGTIIVTCPQNRWEYKWKIARNCENARTSE